MSSRPRILIIGAGVAGPLLAHFLKERGYAPVIAEKMPTLGSYGFGIMIWPRSYGVLEKAGVSDILDAHGYTVPWTRVCDQNAKLLKQLDFVNERGPIVPNWCISRARLHGKLVGLLADIEVRLGTEVVCVEEDDQGVYAIYANGNRELFDGVVCAEGSRSTIRRQFYGDAALRSYGWQARMQWIDGSLRPEGVMEFCAPGAAAVIIPVEKDRVMGVIAAHPESLDSLEKVHERFASFPDHVQKYASELAEDTHAFSISAAHVVPPIAHKGRVVLIGDAEHAVSPVVGMGSSLAMEDAWALANILGRVSASSDIPGAFQEFTRSRLPVFRTSARTVHAFHSLLYSDSKAMDFTRRHIVPHVPARVFMSAMRSLVV